MFVQCEGRDKIHLFLFFSLALLSVQQPKTRAMYKIAAQPSHPTHNPYCLLLLEPRPSVALSISPNPPKQKKDARVAMVTHGAGYMHPVLDASLQPSPQLRYIAPDLLLTVLPTCMFCFGTTTIHSFSFARQRAVERGAPPLFVVVKFVPSCVSEDWVPAPF